MKTFLKKNWDWLLVVALFVAALVVPTGGFLQAVCGVGTIVGAFFSVKKRLF
jgi:hypothetical protein